MRLQQDKLYIELQDLAGLTVCNPTMFRYLSKSFDKNKDNLLQAPDIIKDKVGYLKGVELYIQAARDPSSIDLNQITEKQIYFMAVVAYDWNSVKPLSLLLDYVSQPDDRWYWLYLATDLRFRDIINVEMVRRRTYPTSSLITYNMKQLKRMKLSPRLLPGWYQLDTTRIAKLNDENFIVKEFNPSQQIMFPIFADIPNVNIAISGEYVNQVLTGEYQYYNLFESAKILNRKLPSQERADILSLVEMLKQGTDKQATIRKLKSYAYIRFVDDNVYYANKLEPYSDRPADETIYNLDAYIFGNLDEGGYMGGPHSLIASLLSTKPGFVTVTEQAIIIDGYTRARPRVDFKVKLHNIVFANIQEVLAFIDMDCHRAVIYQKERYEQRVLVTPGYLACLKDGTNPVIPSHQGYDYNISLYTALIKEQFKPRFPCQLELKLDRSTNDFKPEDLRTYRELYSLLAGYRYVKPQPTITNPFLARLIALANDIEMGIKQLIATENYDKLAEVNDDGKFPYVYAGIAKLLAKTFDAESQITNSFDFSYVNYLQGQRNYVYEGDKLGPECKLVSQFLPPDLADLVCDWSNYNVKLQEYINELEQFYLRLVA